MVIPKLDLPDAIICRIDAWRTSSLLPASDPPDLCHEDPTERPKLYRLVHLPGKSRGLVAMRDIVVGEIVSQEKPTLYFSEKESHQPDFMCQPTVQVFLLDPVRTAQFIELYTSPDHEKRLGPVGGRFQTNCIGATESQILLDASMLNHSCRPYIAVAENVEQRITRFRATRQIAKREELCFSYMHARTLLPKTAPG